MKRLSIAFRCIPGFETIHLPKHELKPGGILVLQDGKTVAEFPLTAGVVGVALAPTLAAIGVLSALLTNCTIGREHPIVIELNEHRSIEKEREQPIDLQKESQSRTRIASGSLSAGHVPPLSKGDTKARNSI